MNKERNCQKCIHHISGLCSKWDCEMQTLEDYRDKVIDEFAEKVIEELGNKSLKCKMESAKVFCEEDYRTNTLMQHVKQSNDMQAFAYDKAIEIVKAGGKNE